MMKWPEFVKHIQLSNGNISYQKAKKMASSLWTSYKNENNGTLVRDIDSEMNEDDQNKKDKHAIKLRFLAKYLKISSLTGRAAEMAAEKAWLHESTETKDNIDMSQSMMLQKQNSTKEQMLLRTETASTQSIDEASATEKNSNMELIPGSTMTPSIQKYLQTLYWPMYGTEYCRLLEIKGKDRFRLASKMWDAEKTNRKQTGIYPPKPPSKPRGPNKQTRAKLQANDKDIKDVKANFVYHLRNGEFVADLLLSNKNEPTQLFVRSYTNSNVEGATIVNVKGISAKNGLTKLKVAINKYLDDGFQIRMTRASEEV
jgi:hypothetical protein